MSSSSDASYRLLLDMIRAARRTADVTQAELAEKIGADQSFVSKCERGERRLDVVELRAICIALGTTLIDFLIDFERELNSQEPK